MLNQSARRDNNGEWSKGIIGLGGPNVLNQGTFENGMKWPGDDAKHALRMAWARGDRMILVNRLSRPRVFQVSTLTSSLRPLAGFRPQQLTITIHTAPVAIDKPHGVPAHGT